MILVTTFKGEKPIYGFGRRKREYQSMQPTGGREPFIYLRINSDGVSPADN
jgi:hypothetical protein